MKHTGGDGSNELGHWTRAEFEAALPLYVGGDLEPEDAALVDAWVAQHPADADEVRAAEAARNVLLEHARSFEQRATPDLWPGIREELARRSGRFEGENTAVAKAAGLGATEAPILRGPGRWYERRVVAAAAAVLLVGTIGLGLLDGPGGEAPFGGTPQSAPDRFASVEAPRTSPSGAGRGAVVRGSDSFPVDVTTVNTSAAPGVVTARQGVPFQATGGDAEHLFHTATPVLVWRRATQRAELARGKERGLELAGDR